jgi:D-tyrosyl-tRNA(Tyr) deacylase
MRAVLQRVTEASVVVGGETVGAIGQGLLILLGVEQGDSETDARHLAEKCAQLRIFEDWEGKMNLSAADIGGQLLVVSQFTLLADCRKGRRPGFSRAAQPDAADALYRRFVELLRGCGLTVETGVFQAEMKVKLINDGPVTMLLDSRKGF